ncbi:MAG: hypothetical protein A2341_11810 [Deltaproteobacteria bacterium RIFOXYB12_FULL_58_9]|nr:MAG: hypothetical protein A2341_11810 [Deltaproteobacteria bacterium RIFOXYB12_FULL_58_9]
MKPLLGSLLICAFSASPARAQPTASLEVITLEQALARTRQNNATWKSLDEYIVQADDYRSIGVGLFLPKIMGEGKWTHLGERNVPDLAALDQMTGLLGALTEGMLEAHPEQFARFAPYLQSDSSGGESPFENFVPRQDKLSATFSLFVPVFDAKSIAFVRGGYDQYDSALQKIGYAREQLLFGVAKLYFGLCTLQRMVKVTDMAMASAQEHLRGTKERAAAESATELEVKRAELEVRKNEARRIQVVAELEKAKATFRYLTGFAGDFLVVDPELASDIEQAHEKDWLDLAQRQRKDLVAAKIDVLVSGHEEGKVWAQYLPTVNAVGVAMFDNDSASRFDDDPFSWVVMATLNINIWDGGIRERQLDIAESQARQAALAVTDLQSKVNSSVSQARRALDDSTAARTVTEKQVEVARAARDLAVASEKEGMATYLAVIDANTMVEGAEAQLLAAELSEAVALLDLWAASGNPLIWVTQSP